MRKDLIRYFLYLNCNNLIHRKLKVKKNELSQYNNDLYIYFRSLLLSRYSYEKCENKCYF